MKISKILVPALEVNGQTVGDTDKTGNSEPIRNRHMYTQVKVTDKIRKFIISHEMNFRDKALLKLVEVAIQRY